MKRAAILLLGLAACHAQDWRAREISAAEQKIRDAVRDPAAAFTNVQLTGDEATGQSCGKVRITNGSATYASPMRFIVYIDGTAGPFTEGGLGGQPVSEDDFNAHWQADCVNEGYRTSP
jgi:hypothetical protein